MRPTGGYFSTSYSFIIKALTTEKNVLFPKSDTVGHSEGDIGGVQPRVFVAVTEETKGSK